ncbi:hypothetical protein K1719_043850 [Acacia pycnantha]|nr:hypothetical protein K1719_043850 [Acacia pycnantha]
MRETGLLEAPIILEAHTSSLGDFLEVEHRFDDDMFHSTTMELEGMVMAPIVLEAHTSSLGDFLEVEHRFGDGMFHSTAAELKEWSWVSRGIVGECYSRTEEFSLRPPISMTELRRQGVFAIDSRIRFILWSEEEEKDKHGQIYYVYEIDGAGTHSLISVTCVKNKLYAHFVNAPTPEWNRDKEILRHVHESFKTMGSF